MKHEMTGGDLFYNPFAEENEEFFDGAQAFDAILARYVADEIKHDYTADQFVKDAEALLLDASFQEHWRDMSYIAAQMHQLCGDDHGVLQQRFEQSSAFSTLMHEGHDHNDHESHDHDDNSDKKSKKKKQKKKLGFWALETTQKNRASKDSHVRDYITACSQQLSIDYDA